MNVNKGSTMESQLAAWPEGFENVTCPNALILVGGTMLYGDMVTPAHVRETYLAIASETYKNHISVNQACRLMNQVEIWQNRYLQLCDFAAIQGGGRHVLEHKYLCVQYFKDQLEGLIESLELHRSLDCDPDERQNNCDLSNLINTKMKSTNDYRHV
jgi:hypothetical protein